MANGNATIIVGSARLGSARPANQSFPVKPSVFSGVSAVGGRK